MTKDRNHDLEEARKSWKMEADDYLLKAATVDIDDYPEDIQEIIRSEIHRRKLEGLEYREPREIREEEEVFDLWTSLYTPRIPLLSKMVSPLIFLFEKAGGAVGVLLGAALRKMFYKKTKELNVKEDIIHRRR